MTKYVFQALPTSEDILEKLNHFGICIVPGYADSKMVESLRNSFESLLGDKECECILSKTGHPTNKDGIQVLIDPIEAEKEDMGVFKEIFQSDEIKDICHKYFSPHKFDLNPRILLNHLKPSPVQILPWHFDRIQTLKFWMYAKDTTKDDGAFEYCLGSHWEGRYRSGYYMATGKSVFEIPNDVPDNRIFNPVSVEAKAGDLIVFDPDGFHRGGIVKSNHERCVVRADTFPIPSRKYGDKFLSPGWWLRSQINLGKIFRNKTFRVLGDRIKDDAMNREDKKCREQSN